MIGNYVEKLKELETRVVLFFYIMKLNVRGFRKFIELHKKFYYKGKKYTLMICGILEPKKTDLGFITALREFE